MKLQFLDNEDDWLGMYIDGELIYEGHSIDYRKILDILKIDYEIKIVDDSFEEWGNICPETFPNDLE